MNMEEHGIVWRGEQTPASDAGEDVPGWGFRWVRPGEALQDGDQIKQVRMSGTTWLACARAGRVITNSESFTWRRRITTAHDAVPAARAETGTGDTRAWRRSEIYHRFVVGASSYARWDPGPVADHYFDRLCDLVDDIVGSYAAPPAVGPKLTDDERLLISCARHEWAAHALFWRDNDDSVADESDRNAATLDGLLARAAKEGER
jgi:hypothetical protein